MAMVNWIMVTEAGGRKNTHTQIIPRMWLAEPGPISGPPKGESQAGHPECTLHSDAYHCMGYCKLDHSLILIFTALLVLCGNIVVYVEKWKSKGPIILMCPCVPGRLEAGRATSQCWERFSPCRVPAPLCSLSHWRGPWWGIKS